MKINQILTTNPILALTLSFLTANMAFADSTIPLVTDPYAVFTEPALQRPSYLSPVTDPTFNTKITRVGGNAGTSFALSGGGTDTWSTYTRHNYAKQQVWNADQSLLMIINANRRIFLDGNTYQPKFLRYQHGDDRWHPTLPNIQISANASRLEWFDVATGAQIRNWTLPFAVSWGMGSGEGNPSSDGRFVALGDATRMFIVDMDPQAPLATYASGNRRIGPTADISAGGSYDWISVSPSGKYAVVRYYTGAIRVFDINPTTLELTPRVMATSTAQCNQPTPTQGYLVPIGHADMAMNPFDNNEDVIIGQAMGGCPVAGGAVLITRLKDNLTSQLITGRSATMSHVSTRNTQRPGWVYVTFYNPANYQWDAAGLRNDDELVAVKLDGSGSVERLAHAHTLSLNYYDAQAQAVPSPDGKRVLWASNWSLYGNGSISDIKPYVVDTRP